MRERACSYFTTTVLFHLLILALVPAAAHADLWRSPLDPLTFLVIHKRIDASAGDPLSGVVTFAPLPLDLAAALGEHVIEYESFVAAYLPPAEAHALVPRLATEHWVFELGIDRRIHLPWHAFEAGDDKHRSADFAVSLEPHPVPGFYLLQFAFPLQEEWLEELEGCAVKRVADFQQRTVLVQASGLSSILQCKTAQYLAWIDAYRATDRVTPEMLRDPAPFGYTLHYPPGTDLGAKSASWPGGVVELDRYQSIDGFASIQIRATPFDLRLLAADDPDLLSVTHRSELALSDERQGQIVAGNYNTNGTVTATGYRAWLNSRGLLSDANQQLVGLIDSGYEDGSFLSGTHNPDLENPRRLTAAVKLPPGTTSGADRQGHGTMVAGIIAGEGAPGFGAGGTDPLGFYYGSGISPRSRVVMAKLPPGSTVNTAETLSYLREAVAFCRTDPATGSDRAFVVNNSYNSFRRDGNGTILPINEYDEAAKTFDALALDGNLSQAGAQPTTIVFSAGNYAYDYSTGNVRVDSVSSPATAKNVISVGATTSYRPAPAPPLPCQPNSDGSRPPDQDATHVSGIGLFSGQGAYFSAGTGSKRLHEVRIKPDLVAPGVRTFSTVPFNPIHYLSPVGCTKYYPDPPTEIYHHTYGTGTSFSAPVVSGAAALARKWFLDRGTNPSPSLIKAALIATADDLGIYPDHRPSFRSGWGRVSLNKLTQSGIEAFYVSAASPVSTGQTRAWTRTVSDPTRDMHIVLAWADPPTDVPGSSQVSLKNDLSLTVEENTSGVPLWRGNNFRENKSGVDNGYSHRFQSTSDPGLIDSLNNVEAIFIPANTFVAGQKLTIKVRGDNVSQGPQGFAVYAWNVKPSS